MLGTKTISKFSNYDTMRHMQSTAIKIQQQDICPEENQRDLLAQDALQPGSYEVLQALACPRCHMDRHHQQGLLHLPLGICMRCTPASTPSTYIFCPGTAHLC